MADHTVVAYGTSSVQMRLKYRRRSNQSVDSAEPILAGFRFNPPEHPVSFPYGDLPFFRAGIRGLRRRVVSSTRQFHASTLNLGILILLVLFTHILQVHYVPIVHYQHGTNSEKNMVTTHQLTNQRVKAIRKVVLEDSNTMKDILDPSSVGFRPHHVLLLSISYATINSTVQVLNLVRPQF